jgi:hypothetical protein
MSNNENLRKAAKFLATYIASLSPEYGDRLQILKDERGFDDLQALGSIVCASLDRGEHMLIPSHSLFASIEPIHGTGEHVNCPCGKQFTSQYPGENRCSNECAVKYRGKIE